MARGLLVLAIALVLAACAGEDIEDTEYVHRLDDSSSVVLRVRLDEKAKVLTIQQELRKSYRAASSSVSEYGRAADESCAVLDARNWTCTIGKYEPGTYSYQQIWGMANGELNWLAVFTNRDKPDRRSEMQFKRRKRSRS